MKKSVLALSILFITAANANAVNMTPPASATSLAPAAQSAASGMDSLTPRAGNASAPKANYDKMSREQKLKYITEKRATRIQKEAEKWNSMTDDQKIARYEKRRANFLARRAAKQNNQNAAATAPASIAPAAGTKAPTPTTAR